MKTEILFIALMLIILPFSSNAQSTWTRKADFGGTGRLGAVGFSIGNKGYIGTGWDGTYRDDFWEYDPATNTWTQKSDFGGTGRFSATGFSIGSKGYIGTGNDGYSRNDFWEYDPATNTWTRKADFPGSAHYEAVGFSIGSKGYIGTGTDNSHSNEFWEYDPAANNWTRKADFEGGARTAAAGFSVGAKGYIGTGYDTSSFKNDFWEYDPAANKWTRKADFGGGGRSFAISFNIGSKGYFGTGSNGSPKKDFWEYDPATNTWTQTTDFGGTDTYYAAGFSIGSKGYIGIGWDGNLKKDFWEYTPGVAPCNPPSDLKVISPTDSSAKLGWTIPSTSVKGFCIVYRAINTSAWTGRKKKSTDDRIVLRELSPNTTYKWKMRSICKDGYSKWVAGPDFTTTSAFASTNISDALIAGKFSAGIAPNPVTGNVLSLHITNATALNAQLSISDMQGRVLINQNLLLNGSSNKTIDVSALPKGMYILKIINNKNEQQQIKFVKAN